MRKLAFSIITLAALVFPPASLLHANDKPTDFLYWAESIRHTTPRLAQLMRANLDNGTVETLISQNMSTENVYGGLAFDVANGHLYTGTRDYVVRLNLDGTGRVNLLPTWNRSQVGDIVLDLEARMMYWSEGALGRRSVRRAKMDGSEPETLLNTGYEDLVEGLALDLQRRKLYFVRQVPGHPGTTRKSSIESMNLDGTGIEVLVDGLDIRSEIPHDVEYDTSTDTLYFNLWNRDTLQSWVYEYSLADQGPASLLSTPPEGAFNCIAYDPAWDRLFVAGYDPLIAVPEDQTIHSFSPAEPEVFTTNVLARTFVNYLRPLHLPKLSIRVSQVELCWDTIANQTYQLEYATSLTNPVWLPLGNPILGDGLRFCTNDVVVEGASQRYYRLRTTDVP